MPATWTLGWSKHDSSMLPSKHSILQDLYSPCLNLTDSATPSPPTKRFVYIYIYIYTCTIIKIYIYIYIYTYIHIYIYVMYSYRANSSGFRGIDSSRRWILKGGNPRMLRKTILLRPATWKHGWSKRGSSMIPSKHSIPQDLYSPCLNLTDSAWTRFTPTMFTRGR